MNRNHDIVLALRTLDAADGNMNPDNSKKSRADLRRILTMDLPMDRGQQHGGATVLTTGRPRKPSRTVLRFVVAGALATAVAAALVALPSVTGGDPAFASWTGEPHGMTTSERADAVTTCRQEQKGGTNDQYADELRSAVAVIAERRGVWSTVVLASPAGFSALCITDDSTHLFGKDMIGSIGEGSTAPPRPRELTASNLGTGTMKAGDLSLAIGAAGSDVTAVSYRSRTHGLVAATVTDGHFALWFPGDELKDESATGGVTVEVTYRDASRGTRTLTL